MRAIAIAFCALIAVTTTQAQDLAAVMTAQFEPLLRQSMEKHQVPEFCIAVVKDGHLVYANAFGVRSIDSSDAVATRSLFHMASVTKPFVATAILQLWEAGKVNLDAPVVEYLPYFRLKEGPYAQITVRQLLNHTSGVPDVLIYAWDRPKYDDGALEGYVRNLHRKRLLAAPGERQRYSNIGYDVLGDLIAKVSGKTFETYVQEHILVPLGMEQSTLFKPDADAALLTTPHVRLDGKVEVSDVFPYNREHAPSSTLISSVLDMSRWVAANLNRGELDGARILKDSTYDLLWQPLDEEFPEIGASWFLAEHRGHRAVSHGGRDLGFRSHLVLVPDESLGIVAVSNLDRAPVGELVLTALDVLLDAAPSE